MWFSFQLQPRAVVAQLHLIGHRFEHDALPPAMLSLRGLPLRTQNSIKVTIKVTIMVTLRENAIPIGTANREQPPMFLG